MTQENATKRARAADGHPAAERDRDGAASARARQLTTDAQGDLERYVSAAARHLGLTDWILEVAVGDPGDDACAKVDAPYGQRRATITLGQLFLDQNAQDQRDTIIHELLHLVLMPSWQYIDELLDAELGVRAARIAWLGYTQHVEYSIDQLAATISPAIPLPPTLTLQDQPAAEEAGASEQAPERDAAAGASADMSANMSAKEMSAAIVDVLAEAARATKKSRGGAGAAGASEALAATQNPATTHPTAGAARPARRRARTRSRGQA